MRRITLRLVPLLVLLCSTTFAQEVLDRIVAVVGDKIVLESELKTQMQLYGDQYKRELGDMSQEQLEKVILGQMINDKLITLQAEKDTTIKVTSDQIEQALDEQMKRLRSQFADEEVFQQQLEKEGITEKELRRRYKEAVNSQLLKERLISSRLSKISVSNKEVRDFYDAYKDSIPRQPEGVRLAHILIPIKPEKETADSLESKASWILEKIRKGGDFSKLAKEYSDDASSAQGGKLGYFAKGDMVPSFEKAAFALSPGEVSEVIETQFGFHIIKVEDKKDDMIKASHILVMLKPSAQDSLRAMRVASDIYSKLQSGTDFTELAKTYSSDEESKKVGGDLGWYPIESLSPEFRQAVEDLKAGEVSHPLVTQFGIHLLKILDRKEAKTLSLDEDWDTIKDIVKRQKVDGEIEKWVEKLRGKTYVEVKL